MQLSVTYKQVNFNISVEGDPYYRPMHIEQIEFEDGDESFEDCRFYNLTVFATQGPNKLTYFIPGILLAKHELDEKACQEELEMYFEENEILDEIVKQILKIEN